MIKKYVILFLVCFILMSLSDLGLGLFGIKFCYANWLTGGICAIIYLTVREILGMPN